MELTQELLQNVLAFIEKQDNIESNNQTRFYISNELKRYSRSQINYAVSLLMDDNFKLINGSCIKNASSGSPIFIEFITTGLTFKGHEYLQELRNQPYIPK